MKSTTRERLGVFRQYTDKKNKSVNKINYLLGKKIKDIKNMYLIN